ncbi:hypothetical protein PF006_g9737 [Phytophthora fragariae]|uniref:Uncharacterized protein n=2 Tax=Phytophthora fragariae TaxID=53985 RepID=A0A6A3F1F3_9STRA|nr:hypothetical protein PF009_g11971 [Phytophthora fragariae]KAE9011118.1 hypothetical protein PF011_g9510 [Phytophthora fragariae]KAE9145408.1 hypothetical protein PF006_g9737 [Phytophthora fragariae]
MAVKIDVLRYDDRFGFFAFHHHTIEKGEMAKRKHESAGEGAGKDKRRRLPRTRQCTAMATPDYVGGVVEFKEAWALLKKAGWYPKPPPLRSLDQRYFYIRPVGDANGQEGIDYLHGEAAVLQFTLQLSDNATGKERQVRPDEPHGTAILGVGGAATASRGGGTQGRVAGRGGRAATPGRSGARHQPDLGAEAQRHAADAGEAETYQAVSGVGGAATASRGGGTQGRGAGRGGRAATPGTPRSSSL